MGPVFVVWRLQLVEGGAKLVGNEAVWRALENGRGHFNLKESPEVETRKLRAEANMEGRRAGLLSARRYRII